jgi:hypothetical protein
VSATIVNDSKMTCLAPDYSAYGAGPVDVGVTDTATLSVWSLFAGYNFIGPVVPPTPGGGYCNTPAVLTLSIGSTVLDLMDPSNGYRVNAVDLGYPDVREDQDLRADANGVVDYTRLFGARAVTIQGSLVPSAMGSRQKAWHALAPFLIPSARPVLTYQIDSDVSPRTMTLRPDQLSSVFNHPLVSDFQVGWKAPDPLAYDSRVQVAYVWAVAAGGGRIYNLVFNRVYPAGGSGTATTQNNGDLTVYPVLRIYGPITGPQVQMTPAGGAAVNMGFPQSFIINNGSHVTIDCRTRTAYLNDDRSQSVFSSLTLGSQGIWPSMPPGVRTFWTLAGSNTSNVTQMQVQWQDAYLL